MQNMAVLSGGIAFGLVAVAIMVRTRDIRTILRPQRRGPADPTWLAGWIGMIAAGALIIGTAAAARGSNQGTNEGAVVAG
ncbi:MAG TPA: hypothetical protein VNG12_02740, partial [Acidimicrobiales bacterium]|nr:hypothetical protein [Acidimicrobiales bacterium]